MNRKRAWTPADGAGAHPSQIPQQGSRMYGDGSTDRARGQGLWTPSEGPVRSDPGGAGGEPDGKTVPIPGRTALNER
jgi:hypothetical protein